jgi:hypothetical protein
VTGARGEKREPRKPEDATANADDLSRRVVSSKMNKLSNLVLTGAALVIGACQQLPREDQPLSAGLGHAARAESSDRHARVRAETGDAGLDTMMEDPSDEPDRTLTPSR